MIAAILTLAALQQPKEFWNVDVKGMSHAQLALVQSIQGIANRKGPLVWQAVGGMAGVLTDQMKKEGWTERSTNDVWRLAAAFKSDLKGAVLCNVDDESQNRAATLAGLEDLLIVDQSLADAAKDHGFELREDATKTNRTPAPNHMIAVEQPPGKVGFLRDYAIKHKAISYLAQNSDERQSVLKSLAPGAWVLGWGTDEYQWICDISKAGGIGCAADWCANLSAMESLGGKIRPPKPPAKETEPKQGERVVAFVLSDGDNVQWLTGEMPLFKSYYGSPLRGKFKMTWEVSPLLSRLAPRVLDFMFAAATPNDGFVAAGAPGYSYAGLAPDRRVAAKQTGPLLKAAGLSTVGVIDCQNRPLDDADEILDQPEVAGVVYKDYAPYHGKHGAIRWHNGKPCVGYRFSLWQEMAGASPDEVAAQIAKLPADPRTNPDSYALVTVHAWSFGDIGGPLEAVRRTIEKLPPGTRVVTAPELVAWIAKYLAPKGK